MKLVSNAAIAVLAAWGAWVAVSKIEARIDDGPQPEQAFVRRLVPPPCEHWTGAFIEELSSSDHGRSLTLFPYPITITEVHVVCMNCTDDILPVSVVDLSHDGVSLFVGEGLGAGDYQIRFCYSRDD